MAEVQHAPIHVLAVALEYWLNLICECILRNKMLVLWGFGLLPDERLIFNFFNI